VRSNQIPEDGPFAAHTAPPAAVRQDVAAGWVDDIVRAAPLKLLVFDVVIDVPAILSEYNAGQIGRKVP